MAVAPDERYVHLQVPFFHGWIEFDTRASDIDGAATYDGEPAVGALTRVVDLPKRTPELPEQYVLSAHHGMAMNASGTTLCAAGTMDGYAAIVDRETEQLDLVDVGEEPYRGTNGPPGEVVVIEYATAEPVATIAVGDHPQRAREGDVARDVIRAWR